MIEFIKAKLGGVKFTCEDCKFFIETSALKSKKDAEINKCGFCCKNKKIMYKPVKKNDLMCFSFTEKEYVPDFEGE